MRVLFLAASLLGATPAPAAVPRLVPTRDVTVDYTVRPRDHAPLSVRVSIQAGGAHLRITSPDLPTAFLVDRPAQVATILLPVLKLYATVGIGAYDPQRTVLRDAHFVGHGQERLAGRACTDWTARSPRGQAEACITDDGVILRGSAADRNGPIGAVDAARVQYGDLSPLLFRLPGGYHDAGSLPVAGLSGAGR